MAKKLQRKAGLENIDKIFETIMIRKSKIFKIIEIFK